MLLSRVTEGLQLLERVHFILAFSFPFGYRTELHAQESNLKSRAKQTSTLRA
jgi:hypothetical protein